jgi:hypothetical protein
MTIGVEWLGVVRTGPDAAEGEMTAVGVTWADAASG